MHFASKSEKKRGRPATTLHRFLTRMAGLPSYCTLRAEQTSLSSRQHRIHVAFAPEACAGAPRPRRA
eukprot:8611636-Pyramimonas_sp.AAC.1